MDTRRLSSSAGRLALPALVILLSGCAHSPATVATPAPESPQPPAPSAAEVTEAQKTLNALGYDVGTADGVLGPRSVAAIRSFEKDQHLPADGNLSADVMARLKVARGKLPKDTSPRFEVGETIYYSDGAAEKVLDVANEISIEVDGREHRRKPENFLLFAEDGARSDAPDAFLQPLRTGRKDDYRIYRHVGEQEQTSTVSCMVGRLRLRSVPAGKFKAIDVACRETGDAAPRVEREWAYAPALRQVIRETMRIEGKRTDIRELVAIRPDTANWPMAARTGFDWAVVNALESSTRTSPIAWSSTGVDERFSIRVDHAVVKSALPLPAGQTIKQCLRYQLQRTDPAGTGRLYPGLACQSSAGEWLIPARQPYVFARPPKGL